MRLKNKFKQIFSGETLKKLVKPIKFPKGKMLKKIRFYHVVDSLFVLLIASWLAFITKQYIPPTGIVGIEVKNNSQLKCVQIVAIDHLLPVSISGLQKFDCLVGIDGKDVRGKNKHYIDKQLKGEPGSIVRLTVERDRQYLEYSTNRVQPQLRVTPFE